MSIIPLSPLRARTGQSLSLVPLVRNACNHARNSGAFGYYSNTMYLDKVALSRLLIIMRTSRKAKTVSGRYAKKTFKRFSNVYGNHYSGQEQVMLDIMLRVNMVPARYAHIITSLYSMPLNALYGKHGEIVVELLLMSLTLRPSCIPPSIFVKVDLKRGLKQTTARRTFH